MNNQSSHPPSASMASKWRTSRRRNDLRSRHPPRRHHPTLCYDPRLNPFERLPPYVVEIEGVRNPVASCTAKATPDAVVRTSSPALDQHRKTLLEMVASENDALDVDPLRGYLRRADATGGSIWRVRAVLPVTIRAAAKPRMTVAIPRLASRISCYRCVRVCAEQEGDYAISIMNRGHPDHD
ncbi:MAG: hypothetical protein R2911_09500 [Caldilineaceae bacterium]